MCNCTYMQHIIGTYVHMYMCMYYTLVCTCSTIDVHSLLGITVCALIFAGCVFRGFCLLAIFAF